MVNYLYIFLLCACLLFSASFFRVKHTLSLRVSAMALVEWVSFMSSGGNACFWCSMLIGGRNLGRRRHHHRVTTKEKVRDAKWANIIRKRVTYDCVDIGLAPETEKFRYLCINVFFIFHSLFYSLRMRTHNAQIIVVMLRIRNNVSVKCWIWFRILFPLAIYIVYTQIDAHRVFSMANVLIK